MRTIDIHAHVYRPTYGQGFRADNNAVYPDGFSFRSGVTTFVDPRPYAVGALTSSAGPSAPRRPLATRVRQRPPP